MSRCPVTIYATSTSLYTNAGITAILPGEHGVNSFPLDSPSSNILFNTISPCHSQTEGTAVKEEEWRESTFHEG